MGQCIKAALHIVISSLMFTLDVHVWLVVSLIALIKIGQLNVLSVRCFQYDVIIYVIKIRGKHVFL